MFPLSLSLSQCQTYEALTLSPESTVTVYGTLKTVPEGKTVSYILASHTHTHTHTLTLAWTHCLQAPGGHELLADYWVLVAMAPAGGVENAVTEHSHIDQQLDQRHLMLRGETVSYR